VDFLKLLYDKLDELHVAFASTTHRAQFPRPLFKVVMLYVDEETSILRQIERAKLASVHNKRVLDAGAGQLW
jgi:adenylate kinase